MNRRHNRPHKENQARIERFKDELIGEFKQTVEDALEVVEDRAHRGRKR